MTIERLIRGGFGRPGLTAVLTLAACGLGGAWLAALPRDVFPDLSAPVFNIIVQNAAMSAEELETGIAIPLEASLGGLAGVRRIRSVSQLGVSQLTVEFEPDEDAFRARQLVAERLVQIGDQLPPGTEPPMLSSLTARLNEIVELNLDADPGAVDLTTLRDLAEFDVRNRLLAVPGVAAVERLGGYLRQFQIQPDPERMAARAVSLDDLLHAARGSNESASAGILAQGPIEWTVRVLGRAAGVDDLRRVVVSDRQGVPVRIGDVADVVEAPATRRGLAHRLDAELVSCRVVKQFGADTVAVSDAVREAVAELRRAMPEGVRLEIVYDQAELVREALGGVLRAILIGAALVVLVLIGLLGDLRAAAIVTLTLPLSVLLAGLLLRPGGVGINTMTLGGLAIAVGLLVDAAIIMVENVAHRLAAAGAGAAECSTRAAAAGSARGVNPARGAGPARRAVALGAALEVGRPIAFATLIVAAVFIPLFTMSGIEGRMYRPLALAVVAAVGASLLLSLLLVPVLSAWLLRPGRAGSSGDVRAIRFVKRRYAPVLDACQRHPARVGSVALLTTALALWLGTSLGSDFMPQLDEGAFLVQTVLPPETSLDEVDRLNHRIEDALRSVPEVRDVLRRTGRSEVTEDPMPHTLSDVLVLLKRDRRRSLAELEDALREAMEPVPAVESFITTPLGMRIDEGLGGTPADISVRVCGPDLAVLASLAEQARALIAGVRGVADLRTEALTDLPQLLIEVDRDATARVGLTPGDVVDAVRVALVGERVSTIWQGQRRFDLVVRLPESARQSVVALESLRINAHDGTPIPLAQLASIRAGSGPAAIRREAGTRRIAVEASVAGRDLAGTAAEIRERLAASVPLPPGCFVMVGGRVESQERATLGLRGAIAAALLAVFVLLQLALGSMAEAALILATVPAALVGGIVALALAGETWNVSSLVGLIGLFGIAVQNGLVLVTQTRALAAEGRPFRDALREASIGRVRPKLMTAATAILGLAPLLVLHMPGTEVERPLAVVMTGGLVSSTLFTLLVLPVAWRGVMTLRERWAARSNARRAVGDAAGPLA